MFYIRVGGSIFSKGSDIGAEHVPHQLWTGMGPVLFGMLEDKDGNVVGTDSQEYDTLGIGEQIGGPLEDLTGALNNFIKFVAVVSFVTSVFSNFSLIGFFKFSLAAVRQLEDTGRLLSLRRAWQC